MVIFGCAIILASAFLILDSTILEDSIKKVQLIIGIILFVSGILMVAYDCSSPVEIVSERNIYTNDYSNYELNIDSEKEGIVKEIVQESIYPLAITNDGTKYYFVEFKEN